MIALAHGRVYTPYDRFDDGLVLIDQKKIRYCGPYAGAELDPGVQLIDLTGQLVFPGLIDVHFHGLWGHSVMGAGLAEVIEMLPRFGVTSFLATTVTLPEDKILAGLREMDRVLDGPPKGAECLGLHIEGPHLSPQWPGMANPDWFKPLTLHELERFQDACGGRIRMITFAPEEGQAMQLIPELVKRAIVPVIGHSNATYEQVAQAVQLGLNHATHTFNAMRPLHHRDPGVVGAVLAMPEILAQLIADGRHVHPGAMQVLVNAKGVEGVCLISDAVPLAGLPDGSYSWEGYEVVVENGECSLENGTIAGAHRLMDKGFANLIQLVGLNPEEASLTASLVPARAMGLEGHKGRLAEGYDADIAVMSEEYEVQMTLVAGEICWQQE